MKNVDQMLEEGIEPARLARSLQEFSGSLALREGRDEARTSRRGPPSTTPPSTSRTTPPAGAWRTKSSARRSVLPLGVLDRLVRWARVELHSCYRCKTEEILPGQYLEHVEVTEWRKITEDDSLAVGDVVRPPGGNKGLAVQRVEDVEVSRGGVPTGEMRSVVWVRERKAGMLPGALRRLKWEIQVVVHQYACPGCAALTPRRRAARVPA